MGLWDRIERRLADLADGFLPDEFREQIEAASRLLDQGNAAAAAETLEALVLERPDHAGALSLLGHAYVDLRDADRADDAFRRALAIRHDLPEALLGRGQLALDRGAWSDARAAFRDAARAAEGERALLAVAYRGLGIAYRRQGDLDKAVRELRKAVAEDAADPIAHAYLGEALRADPRISNEQARHHLEIAIEAERAPAVAHLALGRIALDDELVEEARARFDAARAAAEVAADEIEALVGLGDADLAAGEPETARTRFEEALARDGKRPDLRARIGDALRAAGRHAEALAAYQKALAIAPAETTLRRALDTAIAAGDAGAAVRLANDLLAEDPDDTRALVARGLGLAADGQIDAARATFTHALSRGDDAEARIALGRLELTYATGRDGAARAAAEARAALRVAPANARARALLSEARARELGGDGERNDGDQSAMYTLADALRRVALARPELSNLVAESAQAASDFDQPLLVTVMGEFSSGKSTFVNAFIGEDVAPTGITPTTATINVVKYGRERGGRIRYRGGTVETMAWEALFPALRELDAERAREVEVVEILVPLQELQRVNLVDTPGLNSILPEHEEVARAFIARADAVVWLFTAGQGGKDSERDALEAIRGEGKRVLGVLNKVDQLRESEVRAVSEYIESELGDVIEVIVPLAAREALASRRGASDADGGWSALEQALETRFFARARELKREACSRRLGGMLERARSRIDRERTVATETAAALRAAAAATQDACAAFIDEVVVAERQAVNKGAGELYRRAAREILELVRPRRLPFGSHTATPADRDYLLSLLDGGYDAALRGSEARVARRLRLRGLQATAAAAAAAAVVGDDAPGDLARSADDAVRLVGAQVFDRCRAYLRGYLRGGYVDAFFRRALPKLELVEDNVYHALYRDAPNLDHQIALPLARAGTRALASLGERLEHWAAVADVIAYDLEVGAGKALGELDARRVEVAGDGEDADALGHGHEEGAT